MIKRCFVLVAFIVLVSPFVSYGQTDTEFWFAAPRVTTGHGANGGEPIYLRMASANLAATITISIPANPAFIPIEINLPANTAHTEDLSAYRGMLENEPFDQVLNKGILVESTNLITAYYEVGTFNNPDIFSLKGRNALGEEFYVPFQNFFRNGNYTPQPYSSILIVATEDNTTIDITPSKPAYPGRNAGETFTIVLNKGQTYAVVPDEITSGGHPRPGQLAENRLTGTHISSDKPIAVTTSDDSVWADAANNYGCRDLIGDQIVPVDILGDEYIAMRGRLHQPPANSMYESVYIIATETPTDIFVDGILVANINAGQSYRHEFTQQTHYIKSSHPVYVYHVAGFGCEMGGGLLPPVSICTGSTQVSFTRSKAESFFLNILVRAGAEDGFTLNGDGPNTIINETLFAPIPGNNDWLAGEIEISNVGIIPVGVASLIQNEKDVFHLGIINGGSSSGTMYGYFSDFNMLDIESVIAGVGTDIDLFCHGYPIQLLATGGTSYVWDPPDYLDDPFSPSPIAFPDTTIRYTVTVSGACDMTDQASLTIVVADPVEALFTTDKISGCSPLDVEIYNHSYGVSIYSWRFGDGSTSNLDMDQFSYTYVNNTDVPQDYELMLVGRNPYFCADTMFTTITVNPEVRAEAAANVISGCAPLDVDFDNLSDGADKYLWNFGDGGETTITTPSHTFNNYSDTDTTYTVVLKASSEFGCVDRDTLYVNVKPYIQAGFGFADPEYCSPVDLAIHNTSIGATNYLWDFGDGEDPLDISDDSFEYTFQNPGDVPVVFDIEQIVSNDYGCADTIIRSVRILPDINSEFTIDPDYQGCNPHLVDFTNLSTGADKYVWNFGDGQGTSFEENPEYLFENNDPDNIAIYNVELITESDYGCRDTSDIIIEVFPKTKADFSIDYASHCAPKEVSFQNLSIGGTSFIWDFGDGTILETESPLVTHVYENAGDTPEIYEVSLTIENDYGCIDVKTTEVTIYPEVIAGFSYPESGCHPLNVSFANISTGATDYYWDFGDGGTSNQLSPDRTFYNNSHTNVETYTVQLIAESDFGCRDTLQMPITIYPKPLSDFYANETQGCAPLDVNFIDESVGASILRWDLGDGTEFSEPPGDQFHVFDNVSDTEIIFTPQLIVGNEYGCYDTTATSINVFPQITAEIDLSDISGCHPLDVEITNLSTGASASNPYQWIYGDGNSSTETEIVHIHQFQNFSHTDIAEYEIKMKALSEYGCRDSVIETVTVYPKPKSLYDAPDEAGCSPAEVYFEDQSLGARVYLWDFGDGNTSDLDSDVVHEFNQPHDAGIGWFTTTLTVNNRHGCYDTYSKDIKVYPLVTASFRGDLDGCHPLNVEFIDMSLGADTYQWSFGDGNYSNENEPENLFFNNSHVDIEEYTVNLTTTSEFGCQDSVERIVTVYPKPKSEFTLDEFEGCSPLNIRFNNLSIGNDSNLWNFGNGTSDNSANVFYRTFENQSNNPVNFDVSLIAENIHGCTDQSNQTLLVFPEVTASFTTESGEMAGCTPLNLDFINNSQLANEYFWDFDDGVTSTTMNPSHLFVTTDNQEKTYDVVLEANSEYGCIDIKEERITVYAKPIADFFVTPYEQFYPSTTVELSNLSSAGDWQFEWDMDDGYSFTTYDREDFEYTYEWTEGDYQTRYYNISLLASNPYCNDTITKEIMIKAPHPVVGFSPSAQGCPPFVVQFNNQTLYGMDFFWDFGDGSTSTEENPEHVFEDPGRYLVKLVVEGEGGLDSAFQAITVFNPPIADFRVEPPEVQLPYESVRMINLSSLGATFEWDFGDGTVSFDYEPEHYYPEAGSYNITLTVGSGTFPQCFDTMVKENAVLAEEPCNLYFPNAFVPNASGPIGGDYVQGDPSNKIFHPIHEGIDDYVLEVYNRWGELIFRTEDINYGWDGYYRGKLVNSGVFVYKVKATCSSGKEINRVGDVTVYR